MALYSIAEEILRNVGTVFDRLSVIQINRSTQVETCLGFLVFVDEKKAPLLFLKATPDQKKGMLIEQEFDNLSLLHNYGSVLLKKTIPKPLSFMKFNDFTVLVETATPGTKMKRLPQGPYFSSNRFRHHFRKVVRWLYEFQQTAAFFQTFFSSSDIEDMLTNHTKAYRNCYDRSHELDDLLDEAMGLLKEGGISLVPRHGDFCTANILVSETEQMSVIDWESFLAWGWPLSDLLYFISSIWCIPYQKGLNALKDNYFRLFFTRNRHADLIREAVSWYLEKLGVKTDLTLPLSIIVWVIYANQKQVELGGEAIGKEGRIKVGEHLPLIIVEDNYCMNLEILAENRNRYILNYI